MSKKPKSAKASLQDAVGKGSSNKHITKISASSTPRSESRASQPTPDKAEVTQIVHAKSSHPNKSDKKSTKPSKKPSKSSDSPNEKPLSEVFILGRPFVALGRYIRDSWRELRQVRWPNRKATWKMTLAVLVYCAIFMILILLLDTLFTFLFSLLIK